MCWIGKEPSIAPMKRLFTRDDSQARGFSGLPLKAPSEPKDVDGRVGVSIHLYATLTGVPAFRANLAKGCWIFRS